MKMRTLLATAGVAALLGARGAQAQEKLGQGLVMYFQMGGQPGDGATLPRQNGAKAAAEAFGVDLKEQFSAWAGETMLNQFREAMAASPDCIEIMGHPGADAWAPLVKEAESTRASPSPTATPRSTRCSPSTRARASAISASSCSRAAT